MKIPKTNMIFNGHKPSFNYLAHSFLAKHPKNIIEKNIAKDKLILKTAERPKQLSYPPAAAGQCR